MAILGFSYNISDKLNPEQATLFAQWIGAANVIRNQKINEYKTFLKNKTPELIAQGYASIKNNPELLFLKDIPVQLLRNAASLVFSDAEAARKGLRKFPKIKNKFKKRSVVLTKEMFFVEPFENGSRIVINNHAKANRRIIFSLTVPLKPEQIGNQIRISRQGAKFTLSGSFDDRGLVLDEKQILSDLSHLSYEELELKTTGVDRGVALHLCSSDGFSVAYSPEEIARRKRRAKKIAHYQRILARKKRLNKNKTKACETNQQRIVQARISRIQAKESDCRNNHNHQISKALVESANQIIGLEDLNLTGMTKRATPKKKEDGKGYARNRARAKSGLNRSLLGVALGQLATYIAYKARKVGKIAISELNPVNSSKECACCGSLNTERPDQATFICLSCGNRDNADSNAANVLKKRLIHYIKENTFAKSKTRKSIVARKKKLADRADTSIKTRDKESAVLTL
ncbi:putative transposase family protein [Vibrio parahaemolyticus VPCR-2010]|uniref:RNA-guided endonuclease InsQ/TnpB family protein n=1 Tax=Vibrio TaxID=662 RepID=UPI00038E4743|nr:RNA-guided endonuclease TnpB family protein [Vibrio parahaemolyticus]EJG0766554.1 transposase [Vibrio parahaemolyticus O5:K30]EQM48742.1 putative transposase family protein [Vibrio parahaemolyticus VPCR-2010]MCS0114060.1 transposase [Vibrio parahaemolyticus]